MNNHAYTFSIVARDPETGVICVGGTSQWFAYSTLVPFIEAEVGAIATQAECNLSYGTEGLLLLKQGKLPEDIVSILVNNDSQKDIRQLLVIDNKGNTAGHTGKNCVELANHYLEKDFAIAGNILANETVIPTMKDFYKTSHLPFVLKIIKTLQKGQEAGGDLRGKRSAGLLIAESKKSGQYWQGIQYNLRIDDHPEPLQEIERLYTIATAYQDMNRGDNAYYEEKNKEAAIKYYQKAHKLCPEDPIVKFWYAKLLWDMQEKEKAQLLLEELKQTASQWEVYWDRVLATE